jgi:hypothetical protein
MKILVNDIRYALCNIGQSLEFTRDPFGIRTTGNLARTQNLKGKY